MNKAYTAKLWRLKGFCQRQQNKTEKLKTGRFFFYNRQQQVDAIFQQICLFTNGKLTKTQTFFYLKTTTSKMIECEEQTARQHRLTAATGTGHWEEGDNTGANH